MKLKNILFVFITMFAMLCVTTVKAETTAPSSFDVNGYESYLIEGKKYLGSDLNFFFKKNVKGEIIYCVERHDEFPTGSLHKYNLGKELDAKYAYVMENGYPNKNITGNDEKDYFITGLVMWYFSDENDSIFRNFNFEKGTFNGSSNDVVKEMAKLINGARKYSYVTPSIKLNINDNYFKLSDDKKYYVTSPISVTTTGKLGDYTLSLNNAPKNTVITDVKGNSKTTFKGSETFIVKVPVSSLSELNTEFKINVSASGSINKAYLYTPSNSSYQNVAALYPEKFTVSDSAVLKIGLTTEVQISKVDATTGAELPGARLTLKNSSGEVIDTWMSESTPHIIKNLKPGKYTLTEEIAPEGYILSTETVEFEVKLDGTTNKVVMKNQPEEKKVPVYISKQDITTSEELAGAHLEIKDEKGTVIEAWVSTNEPHIIENGLEPGKYFLSETLAPEGYELSTEIVEFVVKEDGTVDGDIIMYNKPETIVVVPSTSSFKTITASLMGIIVIGLGSMIIYKNYKKNEEY